MAYKNKIIFNSKIGQEILFLQTAKDTGGTLLEMQSTYYSISKEPPQHYHPFQDEYFRILEGELTVRINGEVINLQAGEGLHIPAKTAHSMWNHSQQKTVVHWKVWPALNTEYFLENAAGVAEDHKTSSSGMPSLLQVAIMVNKYHSVFRLAKPSYARQKLFFWALIPFSYIMGYRGSYKKYMN